MARKVKCPSCGAKNAADERRCKICAAVLNVDAPEVDPKAKKSSARQQALVEAEMARREAMRQAQVNEAAIPVAEEVAPDGYIGPSYGERSGDEPEKESAFNVPVLLGIDLGNVQSLHPGEPELPPVDPGELNWNAVPGIDIDVVSRHQETPELVPETEDPVADWDAVQGVEIDLRPKPGIADVVPEENVVHEWDAVQGIEIDVESRHPGDPSPVPVSRDPAAEWDAVQGVEINPMQRHPGDPEAPPPEAQDVVAEWDAVRGIEIQEKKKPPPREPL